MVPAPDLIVAPDAGFAAVPDVPAVFLIRPREGRPYLARTNVLRRRLKRLSDRWRLAEVADRIVNSSLDLIRQSGFAEYYDPLTGEPCGGGSFTWTAAMVLEFLGLQRSEPGQA